MVKFVLKVSFASTWSQLCLKFFLNSYKTPWQWHMKDTLQLKILPTWINVGVEPAPRHLTYCSMLFSLSLSVSLSLSLYPSLSNKPSFCYSNNFCCNFFTFLCLKDVPSLITFSNVFQPGHSYSNPPHLFSIKHYSLLTTKITDVNDFLYFLHGIICLFSAF